MGRNTFTKLILNPKLFCSIFMKFQHDFILSESKKKVNKNKKKLNVMLEIHVSQLGIRSRLNFSRPGTRITRFHNKDKKQMGCSVSLGN